MLCTLKLRNCLTKMPIAKLKLQSFYFCSFINCLIFAFPQLASTAVRLNPARAAPAKSKYVFDSASDDEIMPSRGGGGANYDDDSDDDFGASRKPAHGKRKKNLDSDDDFDPSHE